MGHSRLQGVMLSCSPLKDKHFKDLELLVLLNRGAGKYFYLRAAITASANSSVPALPPTSRVVCFAWRYTFSRPFWLSFPAGGSPRWSSIRVLPISRAGGLANPWPAT